jgi:hypothetical protein
MILSDHRSRMLSVGILSILATLGFSPVYSQVAIHAQTRGIQGLASQLGIPLSGEPVKCGFPILTQALSQHDHLPAALRATVAGLMTRPLLQTSILKGGFRVHFDTTGFNAPALLDASHQPIPGTAYAYADSVASIAAMVARMTLVLGYAAPPGDGTLGGGPEYDIYIESLIGEYGRTTPDVDIPDGKTTSTYMEVHNDFLFVTPDSNKGLPALRVTLAHEFHHAIQLGSYAYWQNDVYFHEITSVWMEEVLFTQVNDYYQYLRSSWGHFRNPGTSFVTNDLIMYSRGIWGLFVEKRFDRAAMRKAWEEARTVRPLVAVDRVLRQSPYASGFQAAFTEWALWNYYTGSRGNPVEYYSEGSSYPQIALIPSDFVPPSMTLSQTLPPLASRYHQIIVQTGPSTTDTLILALSNIDLQSAENNLLDPVSYRLILSKSQPDPSYHSAGLGIYVKLDVASPLLWSIWFIGDSTADLNLGFLALAEGIAFPNPFKPDGRALVSIPIDGSTPLSGTLSVYTSNMDLVFSSGQVTSTGSARQMFSWNGTTSDGKFAPSGIYIYVLQLDNDQMLRGKIAVVRR